MALLQSSGSEAGLELAPLPVAAAAATPSAAVPQYLEQTYWWAYVHPNALRVFEREWLVNAILWGNYRRLCDAALNVLGEPVVEGSVLQLACVYGELTPRLCARLAPDARLDVVDVLPIQLRNLAEKLPARDSRIALRQGDSSALVNIADGSFDQVLAFFLLHEQPEATRRGTLAEALRVLRPGGRLVIVDYHRPVAWHPLRLLMRGVFQRLEPFAIDLWRHEIADFMPADIQVTSIEKQTYFGGLYQRIVVTR